MRWSAGFPGATAAAASVPAGRPGRAQPDGTAGSRTRAAIAAAALRKGTVARREWRCWRVSVRSCACVVGVSFSSPPAFLPPPQIRGGRV